MILLVLSPGYKEEELKIDWSRNDGNDNNWNHRWSISVVPIQILNQVKGNLSKLSQIIQSCSDTTHWDREGAKLFSEGEN